MCKSLIVEDHKVFRQLLQAVLSSQFPGMETREAGSLKEAMKEMNAFDPDLVFIDVSLPDGNGFRLTEAIKSGHPETTVVIMTGNDSPEYRAAAFDAGASHFFTKSVLSKDLVVPLVESIMSHHHVPA